MCLIFFFYIIIFNIMSNEKIDPFKFLNVPKNFTIEQLKENFKTLVLKVHPDKGGNEYLFKMAIESYKALIKIFKRNEKEKEFFELKKESQKMSESNSKSSIVDGFNIDKFNKTFEDNKVKTIYDNGHEEFLKQTKEIEQKNLFEKKKFSTKAFNREFEKNIKLEDKKNKFIMNYEEPEALLSTKSIGFTVLGENSINDYSGDNLSNKNLNYMDLKLAYTTSRIVNPKVIDKVKKYNSIDEIKNEREKLQYTLSERDIIYYDNKRKKEELYEEKRRENVINIDNENENMHLKIRNLLL